MITKNNKGFTLVELIIVITILAVLATIAFLSFQSYSSDARDSKRLSDLSNLNKSISIKSTQGIRYIDLYGTGVSTAGAGSSSTGLAIQGREGDKSLTASGYYKVGSLNFQLLGVSRDDFYDTFYDKDYVIGVVNTGSTNVYQLAAKLENGGSPKTIIQGNYFPRSKYTTTASGYVIGKVLTLTNNFGIFKKGDVIVGSGTNTGEIISLSSDFKSITLGTNSLTGNTFSLANNESSSLIYSYNQNDFLKNDSTTVFPY